MGRGEGGGGIKIALLKYTKSIIYLYPEGTDSANKDSKGGKYIPQYNPKAREPIYKKL